MDSEQALAWLRENASEDERAGLARYGIPDDHALGVPIRNIKELAKRIGKSHELAAELWASGLYEARTLAAFVDVPAEVTGAQMDAWAHDFDSWAICDTVCFHLFDKASSAWPKAIEWIPAPEEFVRRAGYAMIWALSVHDKGATDEQFAQALDAIEHAEADSRPLVKKAADMALRAVGKRNAELNRAAVAVADRMAESEESDHAWIGRHALRELTSEKVQARLKA